MRYRVTVHLPRDRDFRRTTDLAYGFKSITGDDSFDKAAREGCYDGYGFSFSVEADNHLAAAEVAFAVCNSYPDEMHCDAMYADTVTCYRAERNRSLSMGDMVIIRNRDYTERGDGRYVVVGHGFKCLEGGNV